MLNLNKAIPYLSDQLENKHLFRRLVITFLLFTYLYVTHECFEYAYFAASKGISAGDTVTVIGALQALTTLLMGYAFKIYSASRKGE